MEFWITGEDWGECCPRFGAEVVEASGCADECVPAFWGVEVVWQADYELGRKVCERYAGCWMLVDRRAKDY